MDAFKFITFVRNVVQMVQESMNSWKRENNTKKGSIIALTKRFNSSILMSLINLPLQMSMKFLIACRSMKKWIISNEATTVRILPMISLWRSKSCSRS